MRIAEQNASVYAANQRRWSKDSRVESAFVTARLKTNKIGFKLGKLDVNFTSQDLDFEPSKALKASQDFRSKTYPRAQIEEQDVNSVHKQLAYAQTLIHEDSATLIPGDTGFRRKRAINAYSKQASATSQTLPGSALGKV